MNSYQHTVIAVYSHVSAAAICYGRKFPTVYRTQSGTEHPTLP